MFEGYTGPLALLCDACGKPVSDDDHHFDPPAKVGCDNLMTYTRIKQPTEDRIARLERDRMIERSASLNDVEDRL